MPYTGQLGGLGQRLHTKQGVDTWNTDRFQQQPSDFGGSDPFEPPGRDIVGAARVFAPLRRG